MSIYSGFATRQQEQSYDYTLDSLLYILQKRILKFYKNQTADEDKFTQLLVKFYYDLAKMQQNKYLQPKFSNSLQQLMLYLGCEEKKKKNRTDSNKEDLVAIPIITHSKSKKVTKKISSYSIPLRPYKIDSHNHNKKLLDPYKTRNGSLNAISNSNDHSFEDRNLKPIILTHNIKPQKKKRPQSKTKYIARQISSNNLFKKEEVSQIINDYVNKVRQARQKNFRKSKASMTQALN